MFIVLECPSDFNATNARLKEIAARLCQSLTPKAESKTIAKMEDVAGPLREQKEFYVIESGNLVISHGQSPLIYMEEGDIIGLDFHFSIPNLCINSEFAALVTVYEQAELQEKVSSDLELGKLWAEYLSLQASFFAAIAANLMKSDAVDSPDILHFCPGETIIEEGSVADRVFTLIEGKADVTVQGVKVGEIRSDEIFGALGSLMESSRLATVSASTSCLITALPNEQFAALIKARPNTALKMAKDMARTIFELNHKVVKLTAMKE